MAERMRVLITVKTYPLPSTKYGELVCTAGVREDGSFVRLYPIDYRYREYWEWYEKYQWIEVDVDKHPKDPRPESYRPVGEIALIGKPIPPAGTWAERRKYILARGPSVMCELRQRKQSEVSFAIVKPAEVLDFVAEPTDREWKPEWVANFKQLRLFGPDRKPLEKIPYKFMYKFICGAPGCKGHKMMIEDWEVGMLYRRMRDEHADESVACQKVRQTFFDKICGSDRDTYFFVGTVLQHGTWIICGTFWPKKEGPSSREETLLFPSPQ
jgi:hypothetical protein